MRVAVVGAGAIGCFLGARLQLHGHEVTLVGRPEQVEAISKEGLRLREASGHRVHRLRAATTLHDQPDLALLAVKTQDVAQACREILPRLGDSPLVAMQNGVQADRIAADIIGRVAVAGAVMMCAATYLEPGTVSVEFDGWTVLGEPFRPLDTRSRQIAAVLRDALPTYLTPHLPATRWSKLVSNLNNAVTAATGLTLPEVAQTPAGAALSVRVMKEGVQVARLGGIRLDHGLHGLTPGGLRQSRTTALIALLQSSLPHLVAALPESVAAALIRSASRSRLGRLPVRGSTWQSLARGRLTEVDFLNGEVVRRGEALSIPTPVNSHLVDVLHRIERTGQPCAIEDLLPVGSPLSAAGGVG